jgi:(p)ppGpp synthase/HD superfamily hydrolase
MRFLPITREAFEYAERMHSGQSRPDGSPFILHPLEVASLLRDAGAPGHLVAAGVLHDLVEKTDVTDSDLEARFGPAIASLVVSVSDDDRIHGYATRKATLRRQVAGAGDEALTPFAADKLSKMRELRREASAESNGAGARERIREPRARRLRHYQRSLALLEERLPRSPLVAELREELRTFLSERAVVTETG